MKKEKRKSKNAQIAVFVIIAIVLVISVALIFVFLQTPLLKTSDIKDPKSFIQDCVKDNVQEAVELLLPHAGYIDAEEPYLRFNEERVGYLCYIQEEKKICINQEPMLGNHIEEEIYNYILPKVQGCFDELERQYNNYDYQEDSLDLEIEILPKMILVKIDKKISFIKNEQKQEYQIFDTIIQSPIFDFIRVTNDIISEEVDCQCNKEACNADIVQLSRRNRDLELEKFVTSRNEEVYIIRDLNFKQEFIFAIRNCVRLP